MKLTLYDKIYLNFAKFSILCFVVIFIAAFPKIRTRNRYWPFIYWSLYDRGNPSIPKKVSRIELRILDINKNWHSLTVKDLYTIDDDSSSQPGGRNIIKKTFIKQPQNHPIYRPYLIKHLERELNLKIDKIEAYRLTWELDYNKYPPLDISQPTKMKKIDSFNASDYLD